MTLILKRVQLLKDKLRREAIDRFLRQHQLSLEADCEMAIIAEYQQRLVGCGAIAGNVLKCIASANGRSIKASSSVRPGKR